MDTPDIDNQGRRMLRRAASPGVTHGGLSVRRKPIGAGSTLAVEIQRRWTPADPAGWGSGPALHYSGEAPAGPAVPSAPAAVSAPRAQVVGQAASPAAQAAASMGASVQRQHLGTPVAAVPARTAGTPATARTEAAPMPVVRRKAAEAPAVQRQAASSPAAAVAPPPAAAPASSPVSGAIPGPAIVRRSAGSPAAPPVPAMPLRQAPDPLSRGAGEGRGGGAPATTVMMPAIVRRSASRPLTPGPSPIALSSPGRGEPPTAPSSFPLSRSGGGDGRGGAGG